MTTINQPKWMFVKNQILQEIRNGTLGSGQRLPSEQALAQRFQLNNRTIRRGLEELVKEGIVIKKPYSGNFINNVHHKDILTPIYLALPHYMLDASPDSSIHQLQSSGQGPADVEAGFTHHPGPAIYLKALYQRLDTRRFPITTVYYRRGRLWEDVGATAVLQGVKGIVLVDILVGDRLIEDLQRLLEAGLVVIHHGDNPRGFTHPRMISVRINTLMAQQEILQRFYALGHRRIVVAGYAQHVDRPEENPAWGLVQTFARRTGLTEIKFLPIPQIPLDLSVLSRIFEPPMPTAVLVPDEFPAAFIFRQCYARNLRIPQDLSLAVPNDNTPHTHPVPLSAPDTLGACSHSMDLAVQYLTRMLAGQEPAEMEITVRSPMQWKESVGPPPTP